MSNHLDHDESTPSIIFVGIDRCLEMLNLSPSSYRHVDDGDRPVNTKKIYSRRPWYAVDLTDLIPRHQDNSAYETEYNGEQEQEEYYDPNQEYVDPVTSRHAVEQLVEQLDTSPPNSRFEQGPTVGSVSEYSIGNGINLREVALVALGGASAAIVLLIIMAGVFVARRRKNSPSPAPSPPILVYPPHDIAGPCYIHGESLGS